MSTVDCEGNCGERIGAWTTGWVVVEGETDNALFFCSLPCMDSWLSSELP